MNLEYKNKLNSKNLTNQWKNKPFENYFVAKKMTKILFLLIFLIVVSIFQSCDSNQSYEIYVPGSSTIYSVRIFKNDSLIKNDSIQLNVLKQDSKIQSTFGQRSIEWVYLSEDMNNVEITGVTEKKNGKSVFLHPPRNHYLKFTELAPFPDINLTIGNTTSISYTTITHGFGDWNGKTIKKLDTLKIDEKEIVKVDSLVLECYVKTGSSNETPIGKIHSRFYFNNRYGFIKFVYNIEEDNETVIIEAVEFAGFKKEKNEKLQ